MQTETLTAALVAQSCRALALAVAVTAAAEAKLAQETAAVTRVLLGEGEYEVIDWPTPSPLLIA